MAKTTTTTATKAKSAKVATKSTLKSNATENEVVETETTVEVETATENIQGEYNEPELPHPKQPIRCISLWAGKNYFTGAESGYTYPFLALGARQFVQYRDLEAGLMTNQTSITGGEYGSPLIVIEDKSILNHPNWAKVKNAYESLYSVKDLKNLLELSTKEFKEQFTKLPLTVQRTVSTMASSAISEGKFDSLNKIRIIDEAIGTDLATLME